MARRTSIFIIAILALTALLQQACGKRPAAQDTCGFVQNSDLQRVSWGPDTPVVMYIDASFPPQYYAAVQAAADRWNNKVGRTLIKIGGVTNRGSAAAEDGYNVIYWMKTWDRPEITEQARTNIYWARNRIYETDVLIDGRPGDHEFFFADQPDPGAIDVESLLVHEFGHALGLAHSLAQGSVMAKALPTADTATFVERRTPAERDLVDLKCEY